VCECAASWCTIYNAFVIKYALNRIILESDTHNTQHFAQKAAKKCTEAANLVKARKTHRTHMTFMTHKAHKVRRLTRFAGSQGSQWFAKAHESTYCRADYGRLIEMFSNSEHTAKPISMIKVDV